MTQNVSEVAKFDLVKFLNFGVVLQDFFKVFDDELGAGPHKNAVVVFSRIVIQTEGCLLVEEILSLELLQVFN